MALVQDQVAGMIGARCAPEMVEADVVQRGAGGEAGNVAAQFARLAVRPHHHRHRVPADQAADAPLHRGVAGGLRLLRGRDRVDIGGGRVERQVAAGTSRGVHHPFQQEVRALGAVVLDHRIERIHPLAGFGGVDVLVEDIFELIHEVSTAPQACLQGIRAVGESARQQLSLATCRSPRQTHAHTRTHGPPPVSRDVRPAPHGSARRRRPPRSC